MSGFVVDASVAIKWVVEEPGAELAALLLDHPLAAPDLLGPECANVLWKKVMRRRAVAGRSRNDGGRAGERRDLAASDPRPSEAAVATACALRHPAYDCIYLCLAEELAQPLVTADERLVGAVRAAPCRRFAGLVVPLTELRQILADERTQES